MYRPMAVTPAANASSTALERKNAPNAVPGSAATWRAGAAVRYIANIVTTGYSSHCPDPDGHAST